MRVGVFVTAAFVAIACTMPTDMCGCPPTLPWSALASGRIRSAGGQRIADATITAMGSRGACPSAAMEARLRVGGPPVDSSGSYRVGLIGAAADTLCVRLVARRTLAGRADSLLSARYTIALRQNAPFDSLRVEFVFP